MALLTATFVAFAVIKNLVKIEYVDDITGERRTETFHRGRYSSRDFTSYRNRKGAL